MKKIGFATILIAFFISVESHGLDIGAIKAARVEQRVVILDVPKMFCPTCPFIIRKTLERIDGVISVKTSFKTKTAVVTYDHNKVGVKRLIQATTDVGYPSTVHKVALR